MSVISQSAMFVSRRMAAFVAGIAFACACALAFALPGAANAETGDLAVGSSSLSAQASVNIPKSATKYKGHYYKVYYFESEAPDKTWTYAKKACEKRGGHLVTITSKGEQDFIDSIKGEDDELWLGGYCKADRIWKWVTGEKWSYENWVSGNPDNGHGGTEDKLGTWPVHWNDFRDDAGLHGYICEWDYSLSLSDTSLVMAKGEKVYVKAAVTGPGGKTVSAKAKWKSSDKSVAKVSSKGMVVAMGPGTCTVTCKAKGMTAKVKVVVKPQRVTGLKAISKSSNAIQLQWKKQSGIAKYQVWMYDTDVEEYVLAKTVKGHFNTARIAGLSKNKAYSFKVRGVVGKKYAGPFSKVVLVRTTK